MFKYIFFCFILLFTSSSPCRKDQFAISYFSTSLIVLIRVYNWEIRHHSLVWCCGLADILHILPIIDPILVTVNVKNFLTPKNQKICDPIIVNPVVKIRPHTAAHPHYPLVRKYPPLAPSGASGQLQLSIINLEFEIPPTRYLPLKTPTKHLSKTYSQ